MNNQDRRQFERLALDGTTALDETGRELGTITQVSGNGMGIKVTADPAVPRTFQAGAQLRIIVVEKDSAQRHVVNATIRHVGGDMLGLEFLFAPSVLK